MLNKKIMKKNLIIGLIKNYNFDQIEPFIFSLKKTNYNGDVVFFYENINSNTLKWLMKQKVKSIPFFSTSLNADDIFKSIKEKIENIFDLSKRFLFYYSYIEENKDLYNNILITDIGDVIFQKNPFDFDIDDSLCCFLEQEGRTIGACPKNSKWIFNAFGEKILSELSNKPICSAGVIIGPTQRILRYLYFMTDLILSRVDLNPNDQGIHNYIVHKNIMENIKLFKNNEGPVITLGYSGGITFNQSGDVINKRDEVPNIVHQYQRYYKQGKRYYSFSLRAKIFFKKVLKKLSRLITTIKI